MHENVIARRQICTKGQICMDTNLHERKKFHEDNLAPKVNFARVKIYQRGSFLHESKKKQKKKVKDKLTKK